MNHLTTFEKILIESLFEDRELKKLFNDSRWDELFNLLNPIFVPFIQRIIINANITSDFSNYINPSNCKITENLWIDNYDGSEWIADYKDDNESIAKIIDLASKGKIKADINSIIKNKSLIKNSLRKQLMPSGMAIHILAKAKDLDDVPVLCISIFGGEDGMEVILSISDLRGDLSYWVEELNEDGEVIGYEIREYALLKSIDAWVEELNNL